MEFKDRLDLLLNYQGVSVYRVSKDTGIVQQLLANYKKGVSKPKQDKLSVLAKYFGVTEIWLQTGFGDPHDHETEKFIQSFGDPFNPHDKTFYKPELKDSGATLAESTGDYGVDDQALERIKKPLKRTERPLSKEDRLLAMNETQQQTIKSLAETVASQQRTIESLEKRLK